MLQTWGNYHEAAVVVLVDMTWSVVGIPRGTKLADPLEAGCQGRAPMGVWPHLQLRHVKSVILACGLTATTRQVDLFEKQAEETKPRYVDVIYG